MFKFQNESSYKSANHYWTKPTGQVHKLGRSYVHKDFTHQMVSREISCMLNIRLTPASQWQPQLTRVEKPGLILMTNCSKVSCVTAVRTQYATSHPLSPTYFQWKRRKRTQQNIFFSKREENKTILLQIIETQDLPTCGWDRATNMMTTAKAVGRFTKFSQ